MSDVSNIITAKGQLVSVNGSGALAPVMAPSADGYYLVADSGASTGLRWAPFDIEAIGLGNVDNTHDADKPVSAPQQAALDEKLSTSTYNTKGDLLVATGPSAPAALSLGTDGYVLTVDQTHPTGLKWAVVDKSFINLDQVDNTTDANKPISIATQAALDTKVNRSLYQGKGVMLVGFAEGDPRGFEMGQDGQVLTTDSSTDQGIRWVDLPPSSGTIVIGGGSTTPATATISVVDTNGNWGTNGRDRNFFEPGETINVTINVEYTPNDDGPATSYVVKRNGVQIATTVPFDDTYTFQNSGATNEALLAPIWYTVEVTNAKRTVTTPERVLFCQPPLILGGVSYYGIDFGDGTGVTYDIYSALTSTATPTNPRSWGTGSFILPEWRGTSDVGTTWSNGNTSFLNNVPVDRVPYPMPSAVASINNSTLTSGTDVPPALCLALPLIGLDLDAMNAAGDLHTPIVRTPSIKSIRLATEGDVEMSGLFSGQVFNTTIPTIDGGGTLHYNYYAWTPDVEPIISMTFKIFVSNASGAIG